MPRSGQRSAIGLRRLTAAAALALALAAGGCGSDDDPPATSAAAGPTTAAETAPARQPAVLPARIAGYVIAPPGLDSYRLSLVFRLRNTILNGLPEPASDYLVETVQATGADGGVALLIGVGARPGASPPPIPGEIRRQIGSPPVRRLRLSGLPAEVHASAGTELVLLGIAPDRAAIAMGGDRSAAIDLARAVAAAVAE